MIVARGTEKVPLLLPPSAGTLSFNYQKDKGNDKFAYRLNYTLSTLANDTEDANFRAVNANNYAEEWAVGLNDRTHALNLLVYYFPAKQWSTSFAANVQSGQPINYISATDLNGDGFSATPRPYFKCFSNYQSRPPYRNCAERGQTSSILYL